MFYLFGGTGNNTLLLPWIKHRVSSALSSDEVIRDVFSSRFRESEANQPNFYLYNYGQRGGRYVTFGISYGFGKGEAMEFSGQKRHH